VLAQGNVLEMLLAVLELLLEQLLAHEMAQKTSQEKVLEMLLAVLELLWEH